MAEDKGINPNIVPGEPIIGLPGEDVSIQTSQPPPEPAPLPPPPPTIPTIPTMPVIPPPIIGLPGEDVPPPPEPVKPPEPVRPPEPPPIGELPDVIDPGQFAPIRRGEATPPVTPVKTPEQTRIDDLAQKQQELEEQARRFRELPQEITQTLVDVPPGMVDPLGLGLSPGDVATRERILEQDAGVAENLALEAEKIIKYAELIEDIKKKLESPRFVVDKDSLAEAEKALASELEYIEALISSELRPHLTTKDGRIEIDLSSALKANVSETILSKLYDFSVIEAIRTIKKYDSINDAILAGEDESLLKLGYNLKDIERVRNYLISSREQQAALKELTDYQLA